MRVKASASLHIETHHARLLKVISRVFVSSARSYSRTMEGKKTRSRLPNTTVKCQTWPSEAHKRSAFQQAAALRIKNKHIKHRRLQANNSGGGSSAGGRGGTAGGSRGNVLRYLFHPDYTATDAQPDRVAKKKP